MIRINNLLFAIFIVMSGTSLAATVSYDFSLQYLGGNGTGGCPSFICVDGQYGDGDGTITFDNQMSDINAAPHKGLFRGATDASLLFEGVLFEFDKITIDTSLNPNDLVIYLDRDTQIVQYLNGQIYDASITLVLQGALLEADSLSAGFRRGSGIGSFKLSGTGFGLGPSVWNHRGSVRNSISEAYVVPPVSVPIPAAIYFVLPILVGFLLRNKKKKQKKNPDRFYLMNLQT